MVCALHPMMMVGLMSGGLVGCMSAGLVGWSGIVLFCLDGWMCSVTCVVCTGEEGRKEGDVGGFVYR